MPLPEDLVVFAAFDALILAGLVKAGCRWIYTRDEHFTRYGRKDVEIFLLD